MNETKVEALDDLKFSINDHVIHFRAENYDWTYEEIKKSTQ